MSRSARVVARLVLVMLGALAPSAYARDASAQPQGTAPPVWCVPGTALCAQGVGQGGGRAGATVGGGATGQVGPGGVQGQAQGQSQAQAEAQARAQAEPRANAEAQARANAEAEARANAGANGGARGEATRPPRREPPQRTAPPPDEPVFRDRGPAGPPLAIGASPCLVGRVGVWSGYHGGACFGLGLRAYNGVGFELELVVLGGGTLPTLDILLRPTLVVPLAGRTPYFDQLSLKIGSTVVGGSIPLEGSASYVRFGGSIGLGYDVALSDSLDWRVLDASFYAEVRVGSHRGAYMDRLGDSWDLGLSLSTGFLFH